MRRRSLPSYKSQFAFIHFLKDNSDLEELIKIQNKNLEAVIAGKSFYVGNIDLKKAQQILSQNA